MKEGFFVKKKIALLSLLCIILFGAVPFSAFASFGSGAEVIANDLTLIKSAVSGGKIIMRDSDFKAALGVSDFKSVTISSLPKETDGTLLYAGRHAAVGETIKRRNVASLVFIPRSSEVSEATLSFKVNLGSHEREVKAVFKFTGTLNEAPTTSGNLTYSVQCEVGVGGKMNGSDPEGGEIVFVIAKYPERGVLEVGENGEFFYTPLGKAAGEDSFTYLARDEWGNTSKLTTVNFNIEKRVSDTVFADMTGDTDYSTALRLDALGIMSGKSDEDTLYFMPDSTVTRAEFVSAALKTLGIAPRSGASFFDDDGDIPSEYRPFVKAAASLGIVNGDFTGTSLVFRPNEAITRYEAARILTLRAGVTDADEETEYFENPDAPVFARAAMSKIQSLGLIEHGASATGALTRRECASCLLWLLSRA